MSNPHMVVESSSFSLVVQVKTLMLQGLGPCVTFLTTGIDFSDSVLEMQVYLFWESIEIRKK